MSDLRPLEPGVMFWAGRDPRETVNEVAGLGVRCGQLLIPGHVPADLRAAAEWKGALDAREFRLVTLFAAYNGEDYTDAASIQATVGWIPKSTRAERLRRTFELSDFGCVLGAPSIGLHVGFVPEDRTDPDYAAVREVTRLVCDYVKVQKRADICFSKPPGAAWRVTQEFFRDADHENCDHLDPANMTMYGTGDPT
ncbi:MAG: hypothetical protein R2762_06895 [Bryobacteraceae bacterium]